MPEASRAKTAFLIPAKHTHDWRGPVCAPSSRMCFATGRVLPAEAGRGAAASAITSINTLLIRDLLYE
jgi:hypothetical protein